MTNKDDLDKYIAGQYNLMDHLTQRLYGDGVTYEQLSPFGQKHIESLARLQPVSTAPDPELVAVKAENALLREENEAYLQRIGSLLRDVEELYDQIGASDLEDDDEYQDDSTWTT